MTIELVISAYRDSLDWVEPLLRPGLRVRLYDKWDGAEPSKASACATIPERLPNVGKLDHTYAHHITERYDDLADWTVFSPDGPHDHLKGADMAGCLIPGERLKVPWLWKGRDWGPDGRLNWKRWGSLPARGGKSWKRRYEDGEVAPAALSFVEWAKKVVGYDPDGPDWPGYQPGGIFGAPRRAITYLPREFYARLRELLSHAREPEEGHYMERLWPSVFSGRAKYVP